MLIQIPDKLTSAAGLHPLNNKYWETFVAKLYIPLNVWRQNWFAQFSPN